MLKGIRVKKIQESAVKNENEISRKINLYYIQNLQLMIRNFIFHF